ncbi:MAG TPA: response regulator [Myxococcales bacterium]|nr:response regulator [Myxococcales bacterium]
MSGQRSILVVDDDADIRESVAEALEAEGYHVATAANGAIALHLLREREVRPDAILLDIMMPDMDGRAFREEQMKDIRLALIPVIVFTAISAPTDTARRLQAAGLLRKPLHLEDLLSEVARVGGPAT